jgi:hypothetical protein
MWIARLIAQGMVFPVNRDPLNRWPFTSLATNPGKKPAHWPVRRKTLMRQKAMVPQANSHTTRDPVQHKEEN